MQAIAIDGSTIKVTHVKDVIVWKWMEEIAHDP